MFQLGKTIVSEEIIEKDFVCNLSACKGACCVDGEAGAPLEKEETKILESIYPKVKPFLRKEGIDVIEKEGTWVTSEWNEPETPLINGADCAYVIFDEKNTALCAIEEAYNSGVIEWKKPISCHLYPVRVQSYEKMVAVNYHSWSVCSDACSFGNALKIPVYQFIKAALIRKFGQAWFDALEAYAKKTSN